MNYKETLKTSLHSAWIILKLVIPIYIIADILYFYNTLSYISFLIEPFTSLIGLPAQTSLAIISGIFLNLYAAVAFAAPLDLTPHQWSILAVFLGICHSLVVESVIMKKIGISNIYSYSLRFFVGLFVAFLVSLMPSSWFEATLSSAVFEKTTYDSFSSLIVGSLSSAVVLSIKIIALIITLIFIMDFIKTREFIKQSEKNVSKGFSLLVGVFLGITYGAGILIKEAQSGTISKEDLFYIGTFLMICHAIIEDTLLFVIFGADFTMVIAIRTIAAIIIAYIFLKIYTYRLNR
ncbi:MAG: nucleoside recognition protein [Campylobacterota bacterium]|nr:nucleoside recognition protein [Campylobacterota bacterium]